MDPTRAEYQSDSESDEDERYVNIGSFCFSPVEPPQHPPRDSPPSSPRRGVYKKAQKRQSEIRKPATYLKSLLCLNIERACHRRAPWDSTLRLGFMGIEFELCDCKYL